MKDRDAIRTIEADGGRLHRTSGSRLIFRHPDNPGTVTVAGGGKGQVENNVTLSGVSRRLSPWLINLLRV